MRGVAGALHKCKAARFDHFPGFGRDGSAVPLVQNIQNIVVLVEPAGPQRPFLKAHGNPGGKRLAAVKVKAAYRFHTQQHGFAGRKAQRHCQRQPGQRASLPLAQRRQRIQQAQPHKKHRAVGLGQNGKRHQAACRKVVAPPPAAHRLHGIVHGPRAAGGRSQGAVDKCAEKGSGKCGDAKRRTCGKGGAAFRQKLGDAQQKPGEQGGKQCIAHLESKKVVAHAEQLCQ